VKFLQFVASLFFRPSFPASLGDLRRNLLLALPAALNIKKGAIEKTNEQTWTALKREGSDSKPRSRRSKQHATQATEEKHTENTEKLFSVFSVCFFPWLEGAKIELQVHPLKRLNPAAHDRIINPTSESRLKSLPPA
jgi:hypothetical protein